MAKIIQCVNQHYYDKEKYSECPYCQKSADGKIRIYNTPPDIRPSDFETPEPWILDDDSEKTLPLRPRGSSTINLSGKFGHSGAQGLNRPDEDVTVGIFKKHHQGNDPVTGWLVCIKGQSKGRDYRIRHGNNWIGRSQNSDIWMDGDSAIANEKQCAVVYDHKGNHFFVIPGNGTITYVNGEILSDPQPLKTGDTIKIGNSEFEFIPFCREGHTWK